MLIPPIRGQLVTLSVAVAISDCSNPRIKISVGRVALDPRNNGESGSSGSHQRLQRMPQIQVCGRDNISKGKKMVCCVYNHRAVTPDVQRSPRP